MKVNPIIAIDMDGVLADFVGSALPLFGDHIEATFWEGREGEYDLAKLLGISIGDFWRKIDREPFFWHDIQPYSHAKEIVELCVQAVGKESVYILSSPCMNGNCHAGKFEWISHYFSEFKNKLILCNHKYHFASPNKFLIDDSNSKIDKFREYGGSGFLYPRPWNRKYRTAHQSPEFDLNEDIYTWRETLNAQEKIT